MKKYISLLLISIILFSGVSCRKMPESNGSSGEISVIEEVVYVNDTTRETDSNLSVEELQLTQPEKTWESTVIAPTTVTFYKDGMQSVSTDKELNHKIARHIEEWYKYEEGLNSCNCVAEAEEITALKHNENAIELQFDNEIKFYDDFIPSGIREIFIPLTGEDSYVIFAKSATMDYWLHYYVEANGLEPFFEGRQFEPMDDWQSTVIAPVTVTFYKDGMQTTSTDVELNHKIARHIEEWFKYEDDIAIASLIATTDLIREVKLSEMAVELNFEGEIKFYGGIMSSDTRTLFIPLTGKHDNLIFSNSITSPDNWNAPMAGGTGLEQYFDYVQFTPLTEEERRWRSTVTTPEVVEFYENGDLVYKSEKYSEYKLNREIAQHIESWFYKKDESPTVMVYELPLDSAWGNDTYIKLMFSSDITFYGEQIVSKESPCLIIPLTGEYAYHIFEGDYDTFSNIAYVMGGNGLEHFFESLTVDNNNQ